MHRVAARGYVWESNVSRNAAMRMQAEVDKALVKPQFTREQETLVLTYIDHMKWSTRNIKWATKHFNKAERFQKKANRIREREERRNRNGTV